MRQKFDTRWI